MKIPAFTGATCATIGVEMFYSDDQGEYIALEKLREVCAGCPEKTACLEWALKHENEGIWAGTTPIQRSRLRTQMGIRFEKIEPRSVA